MLMDKKIEELTEASFHEILHTDIDKPIKNYRKKWAAGRKRKIKVHNGAHRAPWADASVCLSKKQINIDVYLNFKKNDLSDKDYNKLKNLAAEGINKYWSRTIIVGQHAFKVQVKSIHRVKSAIPVDLYIETDKGAYARSMNPAVLGIDASFIYNKGAFVPAQADMDFKLVAAHEFGHSVLMYAGGLFLSWGHKGSTNAILQNIKSSTPGYPKKGAIDLMKYYDWEKSRADFLRRINDTVAMELDVKRLIWGAQIKWVN